MISLGDLTVVCVAVAIVATFFLVTRRFIRQAELDVAKEDRPLDPTLARHDTRPGR